MRIMICTDPLYIVVRSRRLRSIGHVEYIRAIRNADRFFSGSSWKITLQRPEHRWKNTIKIFLEGRQCEYVD
jgi:hypothetical protein